MARSVAHGTAAAWSEESCAIVLAPGFYPEGHQLGADYQDRWVMTLKRQLAIAAQRLATVLNQALPGR